MSSLEDRLRDIYGALADTVDPSEVPDLPVGRERGRTRSIRLVSILAAAAAVILVTVLTTIPRGAPDRPHPHAPHPRKVKTKVIPAASGPAFTVVDRGSALAVYRTRTGAKVATLRAPRGQRFKLVASGGTARSFLAAASPAGSDCQAYFYRFELSATGQPSSLAFLRSVPGSLPTAVTAIPGGDGYAYSTVHCRTAPPNGEIGISGPAGNRGWAYDLGDNYAVSLAAAGDGQTLAFSLTSPSGDMLLNTNSAARTVDRASRILRTAPASPTMAISHDGRTLYTCESGTLAAYSIATGVLLRVLHQWSAEEVDCQISLDPTGRFLLAAVAPEAQSAWTLTGVDLRTGAPVRIPVRAALPYLGTQLAW